MTNVVYLHYKYTTDNEREFYIYQKKMCRILAGTSPKSQKIPGICTLNFVNRNTMMMRVFWRKLFELTWR